eukprot:TRINITY_DN16135_c0_g1_i1.p1 TRINITY_DN16135_c0_g1~~TRINITY_DN16135_c0_g1_i1.p1  ORF type:complete len:828 (+),score=140.67 TRINITY_DN16135_c0_g1_i1:138-2621(+)
MASMVGGLAGSWLFQTVRTPVLIVGGGSAVFYNWLSDNFSYNRDSWMVDIAQMQAHGFQKDNMDIAAHSMGRDAIRDRQTSISTQLSNNILCTTLFLAMAMDIFVSGALPDKTDEFVINLYIITLGSSIMYLSFAIVAAIGAILVMYTTSSEILTANMDKLWSRLDKTMGSYGRHLAAEFENRAYKEMFTPPMYKMVTGRMKGVLPALGSRAMSICGVKPRRGGEAKAAREAGEHQEEPTGSFNQTPENVERLYQIVVAYGDEWQDRARVWLPIQSHSRLFALLGVKSLFDAWGYFCLAKFFGAQSHGWALWLIQVIFIFLEVSLIPFLIALGIGSSMSISNAVLMGAAPLTALVAATTCNAWIDRVCIPLCYSMHLWLNLVGLFAYAGPKRKAEDAAEEYVQKSRSEKRPSLWEQDSAESQTSLEEKEPAAASEASTSGHDPHADKEPAAASDASHHRYSGQGHQKDVSHEPSAAVLDLDVHGYVQRDEDVAFSKSVLANMLFYARIVLISLWLVAALWALNKVYHGYSFSNHNCPIDPLGEKISAAEPLSVVWPSPYFRPRAMATGSWLSKPDHVALVQRRADKVASAKAAHNGTANTTGHIGWSSRLFVADRFRIYEMSEKYQTSTLQPCNISDTIADIAAVCGALGTCSLRVLLQTETPAVADCATGQVQQLLQSPKAAASHFTAVGDDALLVAHGSDIIRYEWSKEREAWLPAVAVIERSGKKTKSEVAISATEDRLLMVDHDDQKLLQIRDLSTGKLCGTWRIPADAIGAAMHDARVLVLTRGDSGEGVHAGEVGPSGLSVLEIPDDKCNTAVAAALEIDP